MGYLTKMESEVFGRKSSLDLPLEVSCRPNRKRGTWSYMDLILLQDTILLQPKEETPSVGIKKCFPSTRAFIYKWTDLNRSNLESITGFFDPSKVTFIKDEVDKHSSKIDKTEWDSYFNWYLNGLPHTNL